MTPSSEHAAPERTAADAQKRLIGSVVTQKPAGLLSRLFSRGGVKAIIGEKQDRCCVVSVMVLVDKSIPLDGMIMAIGPTGATFRPASAYILDRGRQEVLLRFAERELRGRIASVSPQGYDITFQTPMPASAVQDIVRQFGVGSVGNAGAAIGRLS
jgi:hypothetical protein